MPSDVAMVRRAAWRMGVLVSLFVAGIVVVLCGVAVLIVLHSQKVTDSALVNQAASRADDVTDPPAGVWLAIRDPRGHVAVTRGTPPGLPDRAALQQVARTGRLESEHVNLPSGQRFLVSTQPDGPNIAQAILDLQPATDERNRLLLAMTITGGIGLLLAAAVGVWSSRRAVLPMAAALALQRRFVADASHELRTPLTLLSTRAQMLRRSVRDKCDSPRLTGEIDGLVNDTRQLSGVLDDLLLAADTRTEHSAQPVNLSEIAEQVIAAAEPSAAQHSVHINLHTENRPILAHGSPAGVRRALTALLDNAVHHAHSTVTLSITRTSHSATIAVTDDGPGIDPDILPHVFERFTSTGNPTTPGVRRRYGLGLALVNDIAARHGGTVSATNTPNTGATLSITLPTSRPKSRSHTPHT